MKAEIVLALAACALAGCASITKGPPEQIKVATRPGGADCALNRRGKEIGRIGGTPGFTTVEKSWYDITIRCNKAGYKQAVYVVRGGATGLFFGDGVKGRSGGNDSASDVSEFGAAYDVVVSLALIPVGASTAAKAPTDAAPPVPVSVSPTTK